MSAILARHTGSRCQGCKDIIRKGDPIVFAPDDKGWLHEECERSEGWGDKAPASITLSVTLALRKVLTDRGMLSYHLLNSDLDIEDLPESVHEKFWDALAAEESLLSLLDDVASEHVVERT